MKNLISIRTRLMVIPILVSVATVGCQNGKGIHDVSNYDLIPPGAIPTGPGNYVSDWQQTQTGKAASDRGVLFQSDFVSRTESLSPAAMRRLARMIQQGIIGTIPLFIEVSEDPQLDAARARSVASVLSASGVPTRPDQIQIAYLASSGLDGFQAQQIAGGLTAGGGNRGGSNARGGNVSSINRTGF